jgi:hypothetical protein
MTDRPATDYPIRLEDLANVDRGDAPDGSVLMRQGGRWAAGEVAPGGGGGGFSDVLQLATENGVATTTDGAPVTLSWDSGAAGGAYYRIHGVALYWSADNPTRLIANSAGFYDFDASMAVSGGPDDAYAVLGYYINGTPNAYPLVSHTVIPANASIVAVQSRFRRIELAALDYVEVYAISVGAELPIQVGQVVATRVA